MKAAQAYDSGVLKYELEIAIDADPDRVWEALINDTNAWWLSDFHMVGPDSVVTFDAQAGGHLMETTPDGGSLLWYTVQFCQPGQHTLHLVGNLGPDWGGPSTTNLTLRVESGAAGGSILKVTDAHHGRVDEASIQSLESGWNQLFSDGLKRYVEG